jgi:phosphomannomutase/phosphoglucomutase
MAIGRAFGTHIKQNEKEVVLAVGRDNRLSSESIRDALVPALLSTGCRVIDIGTTPTPLLYFSIARYKLAGGIMITGSHNPSEFNGFKLCKGYFSIHGEEIQKLRRIIETGQYSKGKGTLEHRDIKRAYMDTVKEKVNIKKKFKIVIDAGNATAGSIAPDLFTELNCEVIKLYCDLDGNFPNHLPDPTIPEYMKDLTAKVKEKKADVGIGYDGDADRIGAIDNEGEIIWGDKLLALYARKISAANKDKKTKVVFDVKCSQALVEDLEAHGCIPLMWKTGHSLIKKKMFDESAAVGGEMSGHMFFADNYYGFDDAIFATARLLELMSETKEKLSALRKSLPSYYSTPEIRLDCPDTEKFKVVDKIKKSFQNRYKTIDIDGVRVIFKDGWGLLRASNTQPIVVLRFEAKTKEGLQEIKKEFQNELEKFNISSSF